MSTYHNKSYWHHWPQTIRQHGQRARALKADLQKPDGMQSPPAALTIGMKALGDLVTSMVVLWEFLLASHVSRSRRRCVDRTFRGVMGKFLLEERRCGWAGSRFIASHPDQGR